MTDLFPDPGTDWKLKLKRLLLDFDARIDSAIFEGGKWAREEIWSFASDDRLRVAAAEGADGIDPAQANVPPEWRQYPAFRMDAAAKALLP